MSSEEEQKVEGAQAEEAAPHIDGGESAIEVSLNPEQFQRLRKWLDENDFIEAVTDGKDKALLLNETRLWRKNHPGWKQEFGGEMVPLRVELFSPFIDFIKQYLAFFGDIVIGAAAIYTLHVKSATTNKTQR
jgi:hypothetical protein